MNRNQKNFFNRLLHRYRLTIVDEDTLEQKVNTLLNQLNTIFIIAGILFLGALIATLFLVFGPSEFLGLQSSSVNSSQSKELMRDYASLKEKVKENDLFIQQVQMILNNDFEPVNGDTLINVGLTRSKKIRMAPNSADSMLRQEIIQEDFSKKSLKTGNDIKTMQAPIKGEIVKKYDPRKFEALRIRVDKDTTVLVIDDGRVIYRGFDSKRKQALAVQHKGGIVSVYKNTAKVLVDVGEPVAKGQKIALINGPTRTGTNENLLQLEVWREGFSINPLKYLEISNEN